MTNLFLHLVDQMSVGLMFFRPKDVVPFRVFAQTRKLDTVKKYSFSKILPYYVECLSPFFS
jgi:hypothetical protein